MKIKSDQKKIKKPGIAGHKAVLFTKVKKMK